MPDYAAEFTKIALAHLLAVVSPGADFAIVLRQSLLYGRRTAVWTSVGIGCAISLHVSYSLLGIGLLLKSSALAFTLLKIAGATYLTWIGLQALRAKPRAELDLAQAPARPTALPSVTAAWTTGFLTNALNFKAMLFFVALFPVAVSPLTPKLVQAGYGAWMVFATMLWFALVSVVFTHEDVRRRFLRYGHWIDRTLGVVFIGFAVSLALASG